MGALLAMSAVAFRLHLSDLEATQTFGHALASFLQPGDCLALEGELGAGKTSLSAAIGEALGAPEPLTSPSYLLCHEIDARIPILHLDAYFEPRLRALLEEGLTDRFDSHHLLLVEWADRIADRLPIDRLTLRLSHGVDGGRDLELAASGERGAALLAALRAKC